MKLWNLTKCLSNDEKSAESGIKHLKEKEVNILVLIKYCRDLNLFCVVQPKKLAAALGQDVGSNFRWRHGDCANQVTNLSFLHNSWVFVVYEPFSIWQYMDFLVYASCEIRSKNGWRELEHGGKSMLCSPLLIKFADRRSIQAKPQSHLINSALSSCGSHACHLYPLGMAVNQPKEVVAIFLCKINKHSLIDTRVGHLHGYNGALGGAFRTAWQTSQVLTVNSISAFKFSHQM